MDSPSRDDWEQWGGQFDWHLLKASELSATFVMIDYECDGVQETITVPIAARRSIENVMQRREPERLAS